MKLAGSPVTRSLPYGILAAGLALRLVVAWLPMELLVQKTLPDDAFYYFLIARNVARGNGVSVDGIVPTNGFHPLWAITLLLPFALASGDLAAHLGLTLAAIFDTLAVWLGYRTVKELTGDEWGAVLTALLYGLNPLAIMESANGLETALAACMFALCSYWYLLKIRAPATQPTNQLIFGVIGGLTFLARTDTAFLLLVIGADWLLRWRREPSRRFQTCGRVLLAYAVVALVVAPWLAWNWLAMGTLVQSSGVAAPYVIRYSLLTPLRAGVPPLQVLGQRFVPILYLGFLLFWRYTGVAWVLVLLCWIAWRVVRLRRASRSPVGAASRRRPSPDNRQRELAPTFWRAERALLIPLAGAILPLLVHQFVRWYPRSWYFVPLAFATALFTGPLLAGAVAALRQAGLSQAPRWLVVGAALLLVGQGVREWRAGFYPWQIHMYRAAFWTAANTPPEATIGAFNAGLQGFYSDRTVVNLDGVTDQGALRAIEEKRLLSYINSRGVSYLVDYRAYIVDSFYPFFEQGFEQHLQPVATLSPEYPPYGAVVVYEVR
jgi:4-amino-4-deoxy-L-arabinose transferase-like glycosyltransferase